MYKVGKKKPQVNTQIEIHTNTTLSKPETFRHTQTAKQIKRRQMKIKGGRRDDQRGHMSYTTGEATRAHQSTPALLSTVPDLKSPSALTDRRVTTGKKQSIYKGERKTECKTNNPEWKEKPHSLLVPQISTYYDKRKKKKKWKENSKKRSEFVCPLHLGRNSWEVEKDTWADRLMKLHVPSHLPPPNLLYNGDIIQIFWLCFFHIFNLFW